jgi:hypothetical protein
MLHARFQETSKTPERRMCTGHDHHIYPATTALNQEKRKVPVHILHRHL